MRTLRSAILAVSILLGLFPFAVLGHGGEPEGVTYTALGDSIAEGVAAGYGYVYRLRDALEAVHGHVELTHAAHGGFTSRELVAQLRSDPEVRDSVRRADLLTISIGGNNLLFCARENFVLIDSACARDGVARFRSEWPRALAEIRDGSPTSIGSAAQLLVATVYNPFPGEDPNYQEAEGYVRQINAAIRDLATYSTHGYTLVDVHDDFQGRLDDGRWKVCDWLGFCRSTRDPHPTDAGHEEIARLHASAYAATVTRFPAPGPVPAQVPRR